ncbi:spermidine synthase [Rhodocyclus tenuis]|uniref:fused MFS/spermidine synthase n=1 Tax=Rhodocyclus gracilis TaxID=2929842 RepID=UPI0012988C9C|nr:fused MFS/spermidine synthase [Rhodocyclus gracilis]MRD73702.1 spermidine synthase [Rhodocyclus gracilis]
MTRHSIDISENAGIRSLHFGSDWVQGAMRVRRPFALELAYTREMMSGLLLRDAPWPAKALLVGLGAGSLCKFIYRNLPQTAITVVEIDERVEIAARLHFRLPDDPARLRIVIADAVDYLLRSNESFDLILLDGFDSNGRAGALDTAPFYAACRAHLATDGLLAVNLLGRSRGFQASAARIADAFDGRACVFPSCDSGNVIALAATGDAIDIAPDTLKQRATALKESTGLNLLPTLARLAQAGAFAGGRWRF